MALRTDLLGIASKVEKTPSGGVRVPANLTRTGVFDYRQPDGSVVRELRHPSEVFDQMSLESLADAPVTVGHPGIVSPESWRKDAVGHVRDILPEGRFVGGKVIVSDAQAVAGVNDRSLVELSCGYNCDLVEEGGTYQGEKYDMRQTNIRYNHVALGPKNWGRAGNDVALKMDSAYSDYTVPALSDTMSDKLINDAADVLRADRDAARGERDALKADLVTSKAAVETLTAQVDALKADSQEDKIQVRVDAKVLLLEGARKVLGSVDAKAKDADIVLSVLSKHDSTFDASGKSAEYLRARFDFVVGNYQATDEALKGTRATVVAPGTKSDSVDDAANDFKARNAKAWEKR